MTGDIRTIMSCRSEWHAFLFPFLLFSLPSPPLVWWSEAGCWNKSLSCMWRELRWTTHKAAYPWQALPRKSRSVVFSLNDRLPEASGFILRGFRWACQMPGRGSKLLPSGLRDIVWTLLRCSELSCVVSLTQHVYESPSGPVASLEMTSVFRIFVLFGFLNNVLVLPEEKGKRLSKRAGHPLFWVHKSGASTCPAFPPLLHHCPRCWLIGQS